MLDRFTADEPGDAGLAKQQASAYVGLGNALQAGGDATGAMEWLTRGTERLRALGHKFPSDPEIAQRLAASTLYLGQFLEAKGDLRGAATTYTQAVDVMTPIAAADPNSVQSQLMFSAILGKQAEMLSRLGNDEAAAAAGTRALGISAALAARPTADATVLNEHAWRLVSILPASLRQPREAARLARRAVEASNRTNPAMFHTLALALYQSGERGEALTTLQQGLALLPITGGATGAIQQRLAADLEKMRRSEQVP
jgi:tetratricopeptide (TPR) repeat protein